MQAFVGGTGADVFPNVNDETGDIWRQYGVAGQPAFVFVRADGSTEKFGALGEQALQGNVDSVFG